ncbi:MAG TPA: hypothetical protein VKZ49_12385 [Polyangiaceae bacterium]|nr:hypothetical protein [Polyangiaceae bacterium]
MNARRWCALSVASLLPLLTGCSQEDASRRSASKPSLVPPVRSAPATPRRLASDELTPALGDKAEQILQANPDAQLGTEIPFELGGRRYLARIEEHYHPPGGERRPWGPHKGVSLFIIE